MKDEEQEIEQFLKGHEQVTNENAKEVIDFLMQYESEWPHLSRKTYIEVLRCIMEASMCIDDVAGAIIFIENHMKEFSSDYENEYENISFLYLVLGMCFADLNDRNRCLDALKKWLFYALIPNESYNGFEFYSFRTCSDYAINDLRNNTITMSNPKTFNDPLDCLIFHWYDNEKVKANDRTLEIVYELAKEVHSFVKIRCFVRNTPLPTNEEENPTSRSGMEERYNPLMWAHYADGHAGFCVKYKFPASITTPRIITDFERYELSRWGNVQYKDSVNLNEQPKDEEAFFTKSKVWEYENEVRFLHYDPQWKGDFKPIELPINCVEEIYFGLNCSLENIQEIRKALAGQPVKFFQIETQPHDFYKLTSREV